MRRELSNSSMDTLGTYGAVRRRSQSSHGSRKCVSIHGSEVVFGRQGHERIISLSLLMVALIVVSLLFVVAFSFEDGLLTGVLVIGILAWTSHAAEAKDQIGQNREQKEAQRAPQESVPEIAHQSNTWSL